MSILRQDDINYLFFSCDDIPCYSLITNKHNRNPGKISISYKREMPGIIGTRSYRRSGKRNGYPGQRLVSGCIRDNTCYCCDLLTVSSANSDPQKKHRKDQSSTE